MTRDGEKKNRFRLPTLFGLEKFRVVFIGIWVIQVWSIWTSQNSVRASYFGFWGSPITVWSVLFLLILLFAISKMPSWTENLRFALVLDVTAAVSMCIATFLLASHQLEANYFLGHCGAIIGGGAVAWLYMRWGLVYSKVSFRFAAAHICGAYFLASLIKLALLHVPDEIPIYLVAITPFLALISIRKSLASIADSPNPLSPYPRTNNVSTDISLWKPCVFLAVYSLAIAVMTPISRAWSPGNWPLVSPMIECLVAMSLFVWLYLLNRKLSFAGLWLVQLFFLASALLGVLLRLNFLVIVCSTVGISLIVIIYWLIFTDLSHRLNLHPYILFGLGRLVHAFSLSLVVYGSTILDLTAHSSTVAALALYTILLFTVSFHSKRDPDVMQIFAPSKINNGDVFHENASMWCSSIEERFSLSKREAEIMRMVYAGRSKAYIAETLHLSEATVKTHVHHIYTKLGIHRKDDLQKLIESESV